MLVIQKFDYAAISDEDAEEIRDDMVTTKGFFILPSQLFCNMQKNAQNNGNLNVDLKNIFDAIEGSILKEQKLKKTLQDYLMI